MPHLPRRKVPDRIGLIVALRQLGFAKPELDHDPALGRRNFDPDTGLYTPDELDPDYLLWRDAATHKVKTFGTKATTRGSDVGEIAHERRLTKKQEEFRRRMLAKECAGPPPRQGRIPSRPFRNRKEARA